MSESSPADLAVTFRSIPRRLREAQGDAAPEVTEASTRELESHVRAAATLLGVAADPVALADAVEHRPADTWTDAELATLRSHALDIGRQLRAIHALASPDDD